MNILKLMKAVRDKYVIRLINAPSRSTYLFGQRVPTKYDLKKDYIANMKALAEVAEQSGDEDAVNFAKGVLNSQVKELEALIEEAKGK